MSINPLNALAQPISSGATHDGPPPAKAARREVETTDQKTQEVAESAIAGAGAAATAAAAAASAPELAPQLKKNTKAHKALNSATPSAKECSFVMTQTMATTAQARKNLMAENARKASLAAYQSSLPQNQIEDKTMKVNTNASSSFIAPPAAVAEATATAKAKAAVREAFMVELEARNAAQKAEDETRELAKATETERAALRAEKRAKEMSAAAGATIAEQKEALAARDVAIAARKAAVMEKTVDIQIKYRNNAAAELEAAQANGPVIRIALARAKAETAAKRTVIAITASVEAFIAMAAAETVLAAATAAVTAERAKNT